MADKDFFTSDHLVARADSFMQRRRPGQPQGNAPLHDGDDLPVLTQVVGHSGATAPSGAVDPAVLNVLSGELAHAVNNRLNAEMPDIVKGALASMLNHLDLELRASINAVAQAAIRDFLAERERIAKLQSGRQD